MQKHSLFTVFELKYSGKERLLAAVKKKSRELKEEYHVHLSKYYPIFLIY